jgi:Na+-transporting NADH:ubiquinone oxidoreductase subunit NqrF
MNLKVVIEDSSQIVNVPDHLLIDAIDYFEMMDKSMDKGYQMSQYWVETPDIFQRCQIAADKLLTALHTHNENMYTLMAAYILSRLPDTKIVILSPTGDMNEHDIDDIDLGM